MPTAYSPLPLPGRVLIVEDDAIQAKVLTTVVQQMSLVPLGPVSTATEALALCQQDWPDLAILDIGLPGTVDGIDLANQLLLLGKLPMIFVSAAADNPTTRQRLEPAPPLALLPKPYHLNTLQQLISHSLSLHTAEVFPGVSSSPAVAPEAGWVFVREGGTLLRDDLADIVCAYVERQHAVIVLASGRRHSVRLTLSEVLSYLPTDSFIQCHRAWLVNVHYVEQIDLAADFIILTGGIRAAIGRTYRRQVLQQLRIIG